MFSTRILTDFYFNIIDFSFLDTYTCHYTKITHRKHLWAYRTIYVIINIVWSIVPEVPYSTILSLLMEITYIYILSNLSITNKCWIYIKYKLINYALFFSTLLLHTFMLQDLFIYLDIQMYSTYKMISCYAISYILFCLYLSLKQSWSFWHGLKENLTFNLMMVLAIISLAVSSMLLGSSLLSQEEAFLLLFSLLIFMIILCLSAYRKMLIVTKANALAKIELEQNALQQDYFVQVENNLKSMSILRHDFKNHLLIIDSYNQTGRTAELHAYITKISDELAQYHTIQTPSLLLSSLLNAKQAQCKQKNVTFSLEQHFSKLVFSDFHLVTIFSNILDNAILAASKVDHGYIKLQIKQVESALIIVCENNHHENIVEKGNTFFTTKTENKELHGLGLTSVRRSVETLKGTIDISYSASLFAVTIQLPNY